MDQLPHEAHRPMHYESVAIPFRHGLLQVSRIRTNACAFAHERLTMESFNYNSAEVDMRWTEAGVGKMREEMNLASYSLAGIRYWRDSVVC